MLRPTKAGKLLRSEVFQIEQPADLPARRFPDDQRVRRGQGLQLGGEVRRDVQLLECSHHRTSKLFPRYVRFTPKADIVERCRHVSFVPKADVSSDRRFTPIQRSGCS